MGEGCPRRLALRTPLGTRSLGALGPKLSPPMHACDSFRLPLQEQALAPRLPGHIHLLLGTETHTFSVKSLCTEEVLGAGPPPGPQPSDSTIQAGQSVLGGQEGRLGTQAQAEP